MKPPAHSHTPLLPELVALLKGEHQTLLALARDLETVLPAPRAKSVAVSTQPKLRQFLDRIIALLTAHGRMETEALFPALLARLPHSDHWQVRMLEIQDEAILVEAGHLRDWCAEAQAPPAARFREHGVRLERWLREHVAIEEERLFPRL